MTIRLFFDTETNGLLRGNKPPEEYPEIYPLEVAAILEDDRWSARRQYLVSVLDWTKAGHSPPLAAEALQVNGLHPDMLAGGASPKATLSTLLGMITQADEVICHNVEFDMRIVAVWAAKFQVKLKGWPGKLQYCTMQSATEVCRLPSPRGGYKWPRLEELYQHLFSQKFEGAHGAMADCMAARKCYWELKKMGVPSAVGPMGGW